MIQCPRRGGGVATSPGGPLSGPVGYKSVMQGIEHLAHVKPSSTVVSHARHLLFRFAVSVLRPPERYFFALSGWDDVLAGVSNRVPCRPVHLAPAELYPATGSGAVRGAPRPACQNSTTGCAPLSSKKINFGDFDKGQPVCLCKITGCPLLLSRV